MTRRLLILLILLSGPALLAQVQTPSQVYAAYREALTKATSLEALHPYLSAQVLAKATAVAAEARPTVLGELKALNAASAVTVIAEMDAADGTHVLIVDGVSPDERPIRGTVEMVKEVAGWKLSKETWHSR